MKNVARQTVVLFALILLCSTGTAYSAGVDMKDGNWEISSETSMKMEGMSMPPMTSKVTYCLTREDPVPKSGKDKECKVVSHKVTGNKVSWRVECKKGEGEGEITYRGTTYNGFFKMKSVEDGETMTMNMKMAGRYLGPCPKGQKSGATGETAKQMAAGQQAAVQGQKQLAQIQAEQAAIAKKGEALIKRSVVPAEESGACGQAGFGRTPECEGKAGDLNLKPGEYEITVEKGSRIGTTYTPVEVERKTVCLTEDAPVPEALGAGRPARVKRGKERITWTESSGGSVAKGGILYRGNSLEGAMTNTSDLGSGQQSLTVTKVTGRRTGDGDCIAGSDYSAKKGSGSTAGRDYTSKNGSGVGVGDSAVGEVKILKDPVKGIRNLFGFRQFREAPGPDDAAPGLLPWYRRFGGRGGGARGFVRKRRRRVSREGRRAGGVGPERGCAASPGESHEDDDGPPRPRAGRPSKRCHGFPGGGSRDRHAPGPCAR